jgi:hypothetical protein
MIRSPLMWLALLAVASVLFLLSWHCWQPGVGGAGGGRPSGTRLERFFGWPATYQAELWRSDDQELASRILEAAPFYYPTDEMRLEYRVLGIASLAVDIAFAMLVLLGAAVMMECVSRRAWSRRRLVLLASVSLGLVILWAVSPSVGISL